jgi:hypothetical protein
MDEEVGFGFADSSLGDPVAVAIAQYGEEGQHDFVGDVGFAAFGGDGGEEWEGMGAIQKLVLIRLGNFCRGMALLCPYLNIDV